MSRSVVSQWFGSEFQALHPLLQELHTTGGVLEGPVHVQFGAGAGGILGRRLARKLGVPAYAGSRNLRVDISHRDGALHWSRHFEGGTRMLSVFRPVGSYPDGHWLEGTGSIQLKLGVEIKQGGWYWCPQAIAFRSLPFPIHLLPSTLAYKTIEDEQYNFSVTIVWKPVGTLLSYSGLLQATTIA